MKKIALAIALLLSAGMCMRVSAQSMHDPSYQNYLQRSAEEMMQKQFILDAQYGWHCGFELSTNSATNVSKRAIVQKFGAHFIGGNRIDENWYAGGIAGLDVCTPFTSETYDVNDGLLESAVRPDQLYFTLLAEGRYYVMVNRVTPYFFADAGAGFSTRPVFIAAVGAGIDCALKNGNSILLSLGGGFEGIQYLPLKTYMHAPTRDDYRSTAGFGFTLKLGYMF